jgi:hypothetical protein
MINILVGSVIAIFFWHKTTKDIEEKTELSSWIVTGIYAFLSIVVGVFFIKTYQVATILTTVVVDGVRESRDSLGNVADTVINIKIDNKFNSPIRDPELKDLTLKKMLNEMSVSGGVYCDVAVHNKSPYKIETNHKILEELGASIPDEKLGHYYHIEISNTAMPSLFPFYPLTPKEEEENNNGCFVYRKIDKIDLTEISIDEEEYTGELRSYTEQHLDLIGSRAWIVYQDSVEVKESPKKYNIFRLNTSGTMANKLGFFTAADISQYCHAINIKSSCPVRNVKLIYDVPVEFTGADSTVYIGPSGVIFKENYVNTIMTKYTTKYHIKLPTMANLQLIRSLILTTLITALLALFFSNLYYCCRKAVLDYSKRKELEVNEKAFKLFRKWMIFILVILVLIVLYAVRLIKRNDGIIVSDALYDNIGWFVAGFIFILISVVMYLFFKIRPIYSKKKKEKK